MRPHWHTDAVSIVMTTVGVLVVIHAMRLAAIQLATHPTTAKAGEVLAGFALSD